MDKETLSLWFPMEEDGEHSLVGITGHYADRKLRMIQRLSKMKWSAWIEKFPDTKFVTN